MQWTIQLLFYFQLRMKWDKCIIWISRAFTMKWLWHNMQSTPTWNKILYSITTAHHTIIWRVKEVAADNKKEKKQINIRWAKKEQKKGGNKDWCMQQWIDLKKYHSIVQVYENTIIDAMIQSNKILHKKQKQMNKIKPNRELLLNFYYVTWSNFFIFLFFEHFKFKILLCTHKNLKLLN